MNRLVRLVAVVPFCVALAACGGSDEKAKVIDEHVWQEQVNALEKAKAVEGTLMEAAEKQRQMLEQQSGAAPE